MPDQATFAQQKGHFTRRTRSNSSPDAGFRLVTVNAGRHQRVATKRARRQHGLARLRHVCFWRHRRLRRPRGGVWHTGTGGHAHRAALVLIDDVPKASTEAPSSFSATVSLGDFGSDLARFSGRLVPRVLLLVLLLLELLFLRLRFGRRRRHHLQQEG